jgi:hypothetical protein
VAAVDAEDARMTDDPYADDEVHRLLRRKWILCTIIGVYLVLSARWFLIDMADRSSATSDAGDTEEVVMADMPVSR